MKTSKKKTNKILFPIKNDAELHNLIRKLLSEMLEEDAKRVEREMKKTFKKNKKSGKAILEETEF